jgi:hypothetical protein
MTPTYETKNVSSELPVAKGGHFFKCVCRCAEATLDCVAQFSVILNNMDINTVKYYYERGDFQNWIKCNIGNNGLASQVSRNRTEFSGESLKRELLKLVNGCVVQLRKQLQ